MQFALWQAPQDPSPQGHRTSPPRSQVEGIGAADLPPAADSIH
jgi:hypothetical protein